jgi:hypothetical protein
MSNRSASLEPVPDMAEPAPSVGPDHKLLGAFVGRWTSAGRTAEGPSGPSETMTHQHTYAWLPGGFHLFHRWDGLIGQHESKGIEIIGYDAPSRSYQFHFFDSDGWVRIYEATVHDRVWMLTGSRERCRIEFAQNGNTMTTHWDRSLDGMRWLPLCDVKATKVGF